MELLFVIGAAEICAARTVRNVLTNVINYRKIWLTLVPSIRVVSASAARTSMRRKVIPDYLAVLHHESNTIELANVSHGISGNGNEVSKFARLNRA